MRIRRHLVVLNRDVELISPTAMPIPPRNTGPSDQPIDSSSQIYKYFQHINGPIVIPTRRRLAVQHHLGTRSLQ
jgi:hypothetical protein